MGVRLGSAFGKVNLDSSGVQKGAKAAIKSLQSLSKAGVKLGKSMQSAGKAMTLGLTLPIVAGVAVLAKAGKEFVGIQEGFENFTASAGVNADEMLNNMTTAASGMISQKDAMLAFNNAAGLVGDTFAKTLPDSMDLFGKVAAATGQKVSKVTSDYVTGIGRGSKMILDNLGITVDLVKANADYAASLGITADELTDQQKKLALNEQAMSLLQSKYAGMTSAADISGAEMEQFAATMQDLKDTFGVFFIEALTPVLKDLVQLARVWLPKVQAALDKMSPGMKSTIVGFLAFLAAMGPVLVVLGSLISSISTIVGFIASLSGIGAILTGIGTAISAAGTALAGLAVGALAVLGPILLIVAAVGGLYWAFKTNFGGITTTAKQLWALLKIGFKTMWADLKKGTSEGLKSLQESWSTWIENNQETFTKWGEWIQGAWNRILDFFAKVRDFIVQIFQRVDWGSIGRNILAGLANGILAGIPAMVKAAISAGKAALSAFDKVMGNSSPSKEMRKRGVWSAQGFIQGMQKTSPNEIANALAKPVTQGATSNQQNFTNNFSSGLTVRQARGMIAESNEELLRELNFSLEF